MNYVSKLIVKPERWDQPFDPQMTMESVDQLMCTSPFAEIREEEFDARLPLRGILQNDCRIVEFQPGDIVMRQGDYGGSVILVLEGQLTASLAALPNDLLGRPTQRQKSWWEILGQVWQKSNHIERRHFGNSAKMNQREDSHGSKRLFVQDVPGVFRDKPTELIHAGQMFGEVSALTRSPRTATVIASSTGRYLEMRWQGFRDIIQRTPEIKRHVNEAYKRHSLNSHLRETTLLQHLSEAHLNAVAAQTELVSFGKMLWTSDYRSIAKSDIADRIKKEPIIAAQNEYINGLLLIRSGFARVTRSQGIGEQTIEYLGRGRHFGLREILHNFRTQEQRPWQLSLRAVGYVDILLIPVNVLEQLVLPQLPEHLMTTPLPPTGTGRTFAVGSRRLSERKASVDTKLMETLVEQRLINGTQAMVIDLNRCTRCDDCVRACATAHDGNPRFVREGIVHDQWMFAQACMHCLDPVCMIGCPTGAIARNETTGVIAINDQTCVGCQTCANSCPYNNIKMVAIQDEQGVAIMDRDKNLPVLQATKCDLCSDQMGGPACQRACPHDALVRIDLSTTDPITAWIKG